MKGLASRAVYMRLQPSLLSPPSDPEEREKKREQKKKKGSKKKLHPLGTLGHPGWPVLDRDGHYRGPLPRRCGHEHSAALDSSALGPCPAGMEYSLSCCGLDSGGVWAGLEGHF